VGNNCRIERGRSRSSLSSMLVANPLGCFFNISSRTLQLAPTMNLLDKSSPLEKDDCS
jgi:hypothetical protein